jgi:lantibiotic modifying enzyme
MSSERCVFLDMAGELAHAIAEAAVWDGGRCNWLGALPADVSRGSHAVASLGADLYGGTSGVALFLAEAGARLDDDNLRAVARGAIRHALDHAGRIAPEHRDGLYLGSIGVVYAAARVADLLDLPRMRVSARELLDAWRRDARRSPSSDVLSGCAGAVAGLLTLAGMLEGSWLVAEATRLGDELLVRAHRDPAGWSWAQPGRPSMHHLCGFSHGAAGIGHALAELYAATGEARFESAAERAFDYERSWFDPLAGTWPDLRGVGRAAGRDAPVPTAESWCNGAAGIALSRIRAAELLRSPAVHHDAELAVAACERHGIELAGRIPRDFSLCHGAAGTGDVLLRAGAGSDDPRMRLAVDIGRLAADRGTDVPCGSGHGTTPSLFLGLAGTGMFHLRLSDPAVASPLLVHPAALTAAPAPP